jgi:PiT family inorganic phosphate transporter
MMHYLIKAVALGVLFVNGWTDAPNAIASAIGTRALSMRKGILLAAGMNALGGLAALFLGQKVVETVYFLGDAGESGLVCALLSVILWAVTAWYFGIPTSESHGLMAGIIGASLAVGGGVSAPALGRICSGLVLSVGLGFLGGRFFSLLFAKSKVPRRFWQGGQIASAGLMAFTHGLQDTPKFASVLLLAEGEGAALSWGLMLLCSGVISLGTLLGGGRIIRKVGDQMVEMEPRQGFAADLAGALSLLLSTWQGLPVSTTHAKTCAMMGAAGRLNRRVAGSMFAAWALSFPACGILAYLLTKLFLLFPF